MCNNLSNQVRLEKIMETMLINFINDIVLAEGYDVYLYVEDTDPLSDDIHRCEPQTAIVGGLLWGRTRIDGVYSNFDDLSDNSVLTSAIAQCIAYPIRDVYTEYQKQGAYIRVTTENLNFYEFTVWARWKVFA